MKLGDLIVLSIILGLFSTLFAEQISSLRKMDLLIEQLRNENDSLSFISESFYSTCDGCGFVSLEEWEKVCCSLWHLESIEWNFVTGKGGPDEKLICGIWMGPDGEKKVYYRMKRTSSAENNCK